MLAEQSGAVVELLLEHGPDPGDGEGDASLLQAAISRGYSSDGEIFDIHHLAQLATDVCGLGAAVLCDGPASAVAGTPAAPEDTQAGDGRGSPGRGVAGGVSRMWCEAVPAWLERGGLVVVAYDKDKDHHGPATRQGHGAHYALLAGFARSEGDGSPGESLRLLGAHGMSRWLLVTTPADLHASNAQLRNVKPSANAAAWVVDTAGMRLAQRALFVWPGSAAWNP